MFGPTDRQQHGELYLWRGKLRIGFIGPTLKLLNILLRARLIIQLPRKDIQPGRAVGGERGGTGMFGTAQ